ncbi:hypothetical protein [Urechidicola croceus]|uniref:Secreted protein n=1 Tax=Urechidicola croceus TaxID=1850246 RepID=A0A1D8P7G2_9FLAO|nr:hypothetical protein [Urechidicola croceus]AOW20478.1 hypothetical protein LPB138_07235 [Urechidicola croceus]
MISKFLHITTCIIFLLISFIGFAQLDKPTSDEGKVHIINVPPEIEVPKSDYEDPRIVDESQLQDKIDQLLKDFIAEQDRKNLKYKGILTPEKIREERSKLKVAEINGNIAKIDQYLGGFSSTSDNITIVCRDFQYPDGDTVTIYINDKPVIKNIVLTTRFQKFTLPLVDGLNVISFKALNQGTSGPNTAAFMVLDDSATVISSNEWNLATGAKATLSIAKINEE